MRQSGYYWIKLKDPFRKFVQQEWEVAFYKEEDGWYSIWDGGAYNDEDCDEINEKRLLP